MKINYQILEKQKDGRYFPDYGALIANATCEDEAEYIKEVQEQERRFAEKGLPTGFTFNFVYITRQACGHFEIFQSPYNEYYTLPEVLRIAEEHGRTHKCMRCICNWKE